MLGSLATLLNSDPEHSRRRSLQLSDEDVAMHPYFEFQLRRGQTYPGTRISLIPFYYNERIAEQHCPKHYLDSLARENFRMHCNDGIFTEHNGTLADGVYLYDLFLDDRLFACRPDIGLHHSYLSTGFDVKAAGKLYFYKGRLITVSNESGHYRPTFAEMQEGLKWFLTHSHQTSILFEDHSQYDPNAELNGIRHYHVSLDENGKLKHEQLSGEMLTLYLKSFIANSSDLTVTATSISAPTLISGSQEEQNEITFGDVYSYVRIDESKASSYKPSIPPPAHPLLEYPELLNLTCVGEFYLRQSHQQLASRFWGIKNFKHRPRNHSI